MMPIGDKDNKDGICCHQKCREIICRSKSTGKRDRQPINRGEPPPLARGVPGNAAGGVLGNAASGGSVKAAAVLIAAGGRGPRPRSCGGGFGGAANSYGASGGGVGHVTHIFPPFVRVGAGLTGPVGSIGKDEGHVMDGVSARGGEVALRITGRGTKNKKEKAKILPVDGADT